MVRTFFLPILLIALAGCGCSIDESYDWGDPVSIPDHPAYIANFGPETNTITVLDLDKEEIVGRRRVLPERTDADDFAVWGKKELFFCIDWVRFDIELGEEVTIIDPSLQMQKIGAIPTYPCPAEIYPISGDKAFLAHTFRSYQDSFWTTTLIDMQTRKVLAEFHLQDLIFGVVEFPDGRVYLFYNGWVGTSGSFMREFFSAADSLGEETRVENLGCSVVDAEVLNDSLIAGFAKLSDTTGYNAINIVKFPPSGVVYSIPLTEKDPDAMVLVNNKLYVCHNTGNFMKYGNLSKVSVVDLETKSVISVLDVCNGYPPGDIAYSPATNKIVVVSYLGTIISFIDPVNDEVTKTIVSDEQGEEDWLGYDRLRIPE